LAKQARQAKLAEGLPVLPRELITPAELAAAPLPETPVTASPPPADKAPPGTGERRHNRGKRRGQKAQKAQVMQTHPVPPEPEAPPTPTEEPAS
jgi:hypothetical protein